MGEQRPWAAYARISNATDESVSIEGQRQSIERWAKAYDHELVWFVEAGGVSGSKDIKRAERDDLERRLASGEFAGVVVKAVDRLARNVRDFVRLVDTASAAGASVVVVEGGIDTGSDAGRMMMSLLAVFAEFEAKQISARQKVSQEVRRQQGRALGVPPYGFGHRKDEQGSWRVIDRAEAKVVRVMAKWTITGASLADVAAKANAVGYTTRKGLAWSPESVSQMLRNPALNGQTRRGDDVERGSDGRPIRSTDLTILDTTDWQRLQKALHERSKHRFATAKHEPLILAPVTRCISCSGPMGRSGANSGYAVYRCINGMHGKCRLPVTIGQIKLERFIDDLIEVAEDLTLPVTRRDEDPALAAELQAVTEDVGRLLRSLSTASSTEVAAIALQLARLKEQQALLVQRVEDEWVEVVTGRYSPAIKWREGDEHAKRELVPLFFQSILVRPATHNAEPVDTRVIVMVPDGTREGTVLWPSADHIANNPDAYTDVMFRAATVRA
jgi:site-specific DNA recombinase